MAANEEYFGEKRVLKPTFKAWAIHFLLLALTFCTATIAGSIFPFGKTETLPDADPQSWSELGDFILALPVKYFILVGNAVTSLFTEPGLLVYGLCFSGSLVFILFCHEMGHYVACRIYKVDASLPFFLPTPPMIGPAGTFGAFIKIMSPLPSRRAIFDIGVAGPIAGFVALVPVAIVGIVTSPYLVNSHTGIEFGKPLLILLFEFLIGTSILPGFGNPFYFAAWVGLLVTALNLLPSGQLDGGHAIYAVFGERVHSISGKIVFASAAILAIFGFWFYWSPTGLLLTVLLLVMMRLGHPEPLDQTPLDKKRRLVAAAVLIIFLLSFIPFPVRIV